MNLVGKIFTVFIFLMTLVFASFALMVHATHTNWMAKVVGPTGLNVMLAKERTTNQDLLGKIESVNAKAKEDAERMSKSLTALANQNQILQTERIANEKRNAELEGVVRADAAASAAIAETLKNLRGEADSMRDRVKAAETDRDANFKKVVDLTDKSNNLTAEVNRLQKATQTIGEQLAKAMECIAYNKLNVEDFKKSQPPVGLEGEVTAAPRADLVEISLGADDGLKQGHALEVVRLSTKSYVGRIVVMETTPNRAVCRPDPKMLRSPIQKGDHVFSNLNQVK